MKNLLRFFCIDWIKKSSNFKHGGFWIEDNLVFLDQEWEFFVTLKTFVV